MTRRIASLSSRALREHQPASAVPTAGGRISSRQLVLLVRGFRWRGIVRPAACVNGGRCAGGGACHRGGAIDICFGGGPPTCLWSCGSASVGSRRTGGRLERPSRCWDGSAVECGSRGSPERTSEPAHRRPSIRGSRCGMRQLGSWPGSRRSSTGCRRRGLSLKCRARRGSRSCSWCRRRTRCRSDRPPASV